MRWKRRGGKVRSEKQAANDMQRIMRAGERVLASCVSKPAEESFSIGIPESDDAYTYVTNARLIWMSANTDGALSVLWKHMTAVRQGKKRFKNTLGFSFREPGWSSDIDYPAEYVSGAVAKAVEQMRSNRAAALDLPPESTYAIKVRHPFDSSPTAEVLRIYGYPEFSLKCAVCGMSAGVCAPDGDKLSDKCEGCERSFTDIR